MHGGKSFRPPLVRTYGMMRFIVLVPAPTFLLKAGSISCGIEAPVYILFN